MIATTNLSNICFVLWKTALRWYDRGFTKDERKTR